MGINQCSRGNVLWKATGLSLHSLKAFGLGNRIDIDGNLLFYQIQKSGGKPFELIVGEMALLLKQIAHSGGFVVTIVMDGDNRPDCKRASLNRRKDVSLVKINRMYCRFKVMELSSRLEKEAMDENTRNEIKNELHDFNEAAKSLEKKCERVAIRDDFCDLLIHRLSLNNATKMNENGGYVSSKILKARFQADYVIALRSLEKKTDFIYSSDSDFAALLGNDCILIDQVVNKCRGLFKTKRRKKNEKQITLDATSFEVTLDGASNKKMMELEQRLGENKKISKITWTKAKRPLFEDKPIRLRALIAIALGCDVFDGIKQCGPTTVDNKLKSIAKNVEKDDSTASSQQELQSIVTQEFFCT